MSITIPACVTNIGDDAFYDCYKLIEVYNQSALPITVGSNEYGSVAYYAENVYTPQSEESKLIETDDGFIFYQDGETSYLLGYTGTAVDLVLPDSCNGKPYSIYQYAFYNHHTLQGITIPDSVISIGDSAFENCSRLTSIDIPNSVTSIGRYAFQYCDGLTSVTFENTTGWWRSFSGTATSGTGISSSSLANASTAATYLTDTYRNYYWKRT